MTTTIFFLVNGLRWQLGEAVNLKLESRKRRGVMFNGTDEYIDIPGALELTPPSTEFAFGYTVSAWVYVSATGSGEQIIVGEKDKCFQLLINSGTVALKVKFADSNHQVTDKETIPTDQWVHYAGTIASNGKSNKTTLTLCKNGEQVETPTEETGLPKTPDKWQPKLEIGKSFAGKIADVQIWDKARTVEEIKDSMYLQLTGREADLAGYWRLGAISEEKIRKVVDFSAHGNDGIVHGDAFVSAITLSRKLRDNSTDVVQYSNDDWVAVSARATYIETFEFKTDSKVDPNEISGEKLFSFSYWGKKSRSAEEKITFYGKKSDFKSLTNNWYQATCRFTVPDGVAMMRTFEIDQVKGSWSNLEIREHRVQLVSDSITEEKYTDSVNLTTLADSQAALPSKLKNFEQKEYEEVLLLKKKRELEEQIALLNQGAAAEQTKITAKIEAKEREISAQQTIVNNLETQKNQCYAIYKNEYNNKFNYWCKLVCRNNSAIAYLGTKYEEIYYTHHTVGDKTTQHFKFIATDNSHYNIQCRAKPSLCLFGEKSKGQNVECYLLNSREYNHQFEWGVEHYSGDYYLIRNRHNKGVLELWDDEDDVCTDPETENYDQQWKIVSTGNRCTQNIEKAESAYNSKAREWVDAQKELDRLKQLLSLLKGQKKKNDTDKQNSKDKLEKLLKKVMAALKEVQDLLNQLNNDILSSIKSSQTAQTMPQVAEDKKGLVTTGAFLGFASAGSRVTAMETCEGNVQLSYFDNQGRMRLTNYDATADSRNSTFEQWLPDQFPVCLNQSLIELSNPIYLRDEWTIETWFFSPPVEMKQQKLQALEKAQSDYFGNSVAISGNFAIVGASHPVVGDYQKAAAYIFERQNNGSWQQIKKFQPKDVKEDDYFGSSVAISGDSAIVGAFHQTIGGIKYVGAAYIFERNQNNGSWEKTCKLQSPVQKPYANFGYSVAISGDLAIVAAPYEGSAYIFEPNQNNDSWEKTCKLQSADQKHYTNFGSSVAISGNLAIVGSYLEKTVSPNKGAAYIFERQSRDSWQQIQKLQPKDGKTGECFGYSVAISGNLAIVGVDIIPRKNDVYTNVGAAYIFELQSSGSWQQIQKLQPKDGKVGDYFGSSVAISGNFAIVGAYREDTRGKDAGAVYIFERQSGSWQQTQKLLARGGQAGDKFGYPVAISGDLAIVGAHGEDTIRSDEGAAYIFSLPIETQLVGSKETNDSPVEICNSKLGTRVNDKFYDSGYSVEQLSPGWHHLTAVGKGATTIFYIDGQKVADVQQALVEAENNPTKKETLKKENFKFTGSISTIGNFGKISELRIWKIALSDEEIAINSKTKLTGNEPGLVAYYPLNEGTGTTVRDLTGSGNNGTVYGATWWSCAAPIGNLGHQVMEFNGGDNYIELGDFNPGKTFTIELWVKLSQEKSYCLVGKNESDGGNIFLFDCDSDGKLGVTINSERHYEFSTQETLHQWQHLALVLEKKGEKTEYTLYQNGEQKVNHTVDALLGNIQGKPWSLGQEWDSGPTTSDFFKGQIAEVRIWNKARTADEIKVNMHRRLIGQESDLVAYFPLNKIIPESSTIKVLDLSGNNHHGTVHGAIIKDDNTLPIGSDSLISAEYSTIGIEKISHRKTAIMRRFFATPSLNSAELLPDKQIEELELKWISNAQLAPTILGYIEGAPPVPTENLTVEEDYNGATSVALTMSEDMEFSWNRAQESGLGGSIDAFVGSSGEASAGLGFMSRLGEWKAGFKGNLDLGFHWQNESKIASSASVTMTDYLEMRGLQEVEAKFPHLGKRFIPKNVGYALVVSSLADVFITRLKRSGKMIGYQVQPVDGIPPDINTITFLINPAYTMSGSLDGLTGSRATSDRFYRHVPEMRAQYGSLYPASYYRLQEAYELKQQIDNEDKRRESYFAQFDATLVDETSLNREIDSGKGPQTVGVTREVDTGDKTMTDEEKKKAEEKQRQQFQEQAGKSAKEQSKKAKEKQKEIDARIKDQEKRVHATNSFAGWQKRMENIQIRAGKRNIVNNYVWDGDGGLRTEAQSFANVVEHTVGGSFSLDAGLGFQGEFEAATVAGELTALVTINLTQTMSKTENRSKGLELSVDLSGVESKGITDYKDYPIQPGEKVDRYRFMSFFLEATTKNFNDFFNYVVDPEWLASNDEEARALRQAKGKANKTWRVLHRVTYVERPALMGFGRDVRQKPGDDEITTEITDYFDSLEETNKDFKKELTDIRGEIVALKLLLEKQQQSGNSSS
ncbi:MAG: LamG domain-containing protein [Okeania sp. SIO3I5]|uniref:LamG-like jellyroll fold domain-containing protein n=1 Tax=Okeania sp. SIO3I5 TaxID=2607805 RepID=UPI0013BE1180|nr:LamG-like jellyroll fold domain-containing protein [Okeania sp. SIO3I5]NEQ39397.1 LamG domain-containing protein [Okeania sp. SIO3I5]